MKPRPIGDRFVGVRLDPEDLAHLDQVARERGFANRSEAIRHIVREAGAAGTPRRAPGERAPRGVAVEVPITLYRELEHAVENGWSSSVEAALEKALERGQEALAERRPRRMELDRETAGKLARETEERRRASQEGERRGGP